MPPLLFETTTLRTVTDDDQDGRHPLDDEAHGLDERAQILDGIEPGDGPDDECFRRYPQLATNLLTFGGGRDGTDIDSVVNGPHRLAGKTFGDQMTFQVVRDRKDPRGHSRRGPRSRNDASGRAGRHSAGRVR